MKLNLLFIALCLCVASDAFGQQVTASASKNTMQRPPTSSKNKLWAAGGLLNGYNPSDEIRGMRTEFSKKFNRADGKIDVIIAGPFHYTTEQGALEDIDLNILPATTNEYAYTCDANRFKTAFGGNAAQGVKMVYKNTKIRFGLNPEIKADNWQPAHLLPTSTTVNENAITYENLYDKVKLGYTLSTENLAHTITVADRSVFNGLQADKVAFTEELLLPQNAILFDNLGLVSSDRPIQGNISIVVNNDTVYTILQPRIWDAAFTDEPFHAQGAYSENTHILFPTTTFENLGEGRYKMVCKVASNWLLDTNRGFPLVFDPNIGTQSSFSTGYRYPFNTCRTSRTSQILFRQADIGTTGTINSIGFYQNTPNQYVNNNMQISVSEVSYTDFTTSSLQTSGFTTVNSGTGNFGNSNYWNDLPTSYSHSNTNNLVIQTYFSNSGSSSCDCSNTVNGGHWGYWSGTYNGHRWAFVGAACSNGVEGNPGYGSAIPATRLTITPNTTTCSGWYTSPSSNTAIPVSGGTYTFNINVTTGSSCSYTPVSDNPSWITNVSASSSSGVVTYSVSSNTAASSRNGSVSILNATNNQVYTFNITQAGAGGCNTCTASLVTINPPLGWNTTSSSHGLNDCVMYRFDVIAGHDYTFKTGCGNNATATYDTWLYLINDACSAIIDNDDACPGNTSLLNYTATYTGRLLRIK